jgi:wobble nucleotide-excising tRNase
MAHTHRQDLDARFTTLHSNFTEMKQEVRQLSANIATINQNMYSSIAASIAELKQDITAHIESMAMSIYTKLHIHAYLPLANPHFHTEGDTSSHSQNFQPHHF